MKRALQMIEERDPEAAARLQGIENPEELRAAFREYIKKRHERPGPAFRKPSPELQQIGEQIRQAVSAYYKDPSEAGEAKLRKLLAKHFDRRCEEDQHHIDRLAADLGNMRSRLKEQRARRGEHIDSMLQKMIRMSRRPSVPESP